MIDRTIIVSITVYMDMVKQYTFAEDDTVETVLDYMIFSSGNSGNSIESLLYLSSNAINQGRVLE